MNINAASAQRIEEAGNRIEMVGKRMQSPSRMQGRDVVADCNDIIAQAQEVIRLANAIKIPIQSAQAQAAYREKQIAQRREWAADIESDPDATPDDLATAQRLRAQADRISAQ
jgi:hypothetical protein